MAENEEELKSLLMKAKEESEKAGLKLNVQRTKIMASQSPSLQGEKVGAAINFIFLVSKVTADSECSHEIKRCLFLGRKAMTNLDSTLKRRDITLLIKLRIFKGMVFPVVVYECESWTIKNVEYQIIEYFKLWCWRRRLRVL